MMTNEEFAVAIKEVIARAHKVADAWAIKQIQCDDEGIDPDFESYIKIAVEHFCETVDDLVPEQVTEDKNFEAMAEEIVCKDLDYCDYCDYCTDIRNDLWEDHMIIHDPEGLYGVSSEFTIPRRR